MSIEMTVRPATKTEQMYTYTQSSQIQGQTGCIGHLRADFDCGDGFFSTWDDHRGYLKSEAFKAEFDEVINALRFDGNYGGLLKNRHGMATYCHSRPDAAFKNDMGDYGFRADTKDYSYMFRVNPREGLYNVYCYAYKRDWLDGHLKNAERGIRFIDSHYNNLFKVPDGGKIRITWADGTKDEKICRYIDEYHAEIGTGSCNLFHICEFAERMENNRATVEPVDKMPEPEKKPKQKGESR